MGSQQHTENPADANQFSALFRTHPALPCPSFTRAPGGRDPRWTSGPFFPTARTTYQLNITNVFDDRTIVSTTMGVDAITKKSLFRRSFREDPRIAAFTLRLDF